MTPEKVKQLLNDNLCPHCANDLSKEYQEEHRKTADHALCMVNLAMRDFAFEAGKTFKVFFNLGVKKSENKKEK